MIEKNECASKDKPEVNFKVIHASKTIREKHLFLLYIMNDNSNGHFAWIKNMRAFMRGRVGSKSNTTRYYCPTCICMYYDENTLENHGKGLPLIRNRGSSAISIEKERQEWFTS